MRLLATALVSAAAVAAPPHTFATAGARATATLLGVYYAGNGLWRQCNAADCATGNSDWGYDSLTFTPALRFRATHGRAYPTGPESVAHLRTRVTPGTIGGMRRGTVLVAASAVVALAIAAPALSRPQTTNPGAFETVKVIITDGSITVRPKVSGRGVTGIFILTNRGKNAHTFVIGDTTRGPGKNIGFSRMLRPGQQRTIVLFLDYRGVLPYHIPGGTSKMRGVFTIK